MGDILNEESKTDITHDYGDNNDNNDTYNYTVSNQVASNNTTINLDKCNTISPIKQEVNEEYLFWKTHDDNYDDHSENNNSNPSEMPYNGKRIVLTSLTSWVTKNDVVKHNEVISEQQQFIYDAPKPEMLLQGIQGKPETPKMWLPLCSSLHLYSKLFYKFVSYYMINHTYNVDT